MLLETCGTASQPSGDNNITHDGYSVIFSAVPGGIYRLCWCGGKVEELPEPDEKTNLTANATSEEDEAVPIEAVDPCGTATDFVVDAGEMFVIGPAPGLQDRTCVGGQTCVIDGIRGVLLTDGDSVAILDTCGSSALAHRVPQSSVMEFAAASGSIVSWGAEEITALGGQYRLCWCPDVNAVRDFIDNTTTKVYAATQEKQYSVPTALPNETAGNWTEWVAQKYCARATNYASDFGAITFVAPFGQSRSCISGDICRLGTMSGMYLSDDDEYLMLDTCGTGDAVPRAPDMGYLPVFLGKQVQRGNDTVTLGNTVTTAPGGQYRLCWCASGFDCTMLESFRVMLESCI
jgi:hypothetical protein